MYYLASYPETVRSLLTDGSFNWLSASRNEDSSYHNHEQTFFIQGPKAKKLIEHFFQSRVGAIIKAIIRNNTQQDQKKG